MLSEIPHIIVAYQATTVHDTSWTAAAAGNHLRKSNNSRAEGGKRGSCRGNVAITCTVGRSLSPSLPLTQVFQPACFAHSLAADQVDCDG